MTQDNFELPLGMSEEDIKLPAPRGTVDISSDSFDEITKDFYRAVLHITVYTPDGFTKDIPVASTFVHRDADDEECKRDVINHYNTFVNTKS